MEDRIHIAKTEKEYKEGLKNPSKNIMYFPNANQMTMKGMRTPIKYYGITDGRITDEGYAKPGQKFNVNGVSTLEVRAPQMRYGGRATYQLSGPTSEQVAQAAKELSSKPRNLTIQDEVSDPNLVAMIERVLANPNDPNNQALLSDPKFLALVDAYRNKPKPITEVLNNLIAVIQTDPTNAAAAVANFQSLLSSYSTKDLETALPLIKQFESRFTPDEFQGINRTIGDKITKRDTELAASNPNNLVVTTNTGTVPVVNQPVINTTTQPVVTTTTQPVVVAKPPKPRGTAYPGYTIPEWIGPGKEYESVEDYQRAIKEFANETGTPYILSGANQGMDNIYGRDSHLFLTADPKRKDAFQKWKENKKTPTVTTTPAVTTTVTGNPATTTTPAEVKKEEVKTEPKKDVTVDGDFGKRTLRYTDGNWYTTPSGMSYRTRPMNDRGVLYEMPDGSVKKSEIIPEEVMDYWKKMSPGNVKIKDIIDYMQGGSKDSRPVNLSNYESMKTFPSVKIAQKLKGAYDKLDEGFDNFTNMMNSDRSDRAARRAERFLARAEAAEAIGNDRQAGRLYRKADRQIARIEPLKRIQDANEARKDFEAQIGLNRMDYRLGLKENRANEKMITAKSESLMSPEYYQNLKYNKQFVQSGNEDRRRERIEGRYNRAELDAIRKAERNRIIDDSRDFRTGLIQNYKTIKNQYNEEDKNERVADVFRDRDITTEKRLNDAIKNLAEKDAIQKQNRRNRDELLRLKRLGEENKEKNKLPIYDQNDEELSTYKLGGKLPKFQLSGTFNPTPSTTGIFTEGRFIVPSLTPKSSFEEFQMPEIKFPEITDKRLIEGYGKAGYPGIAYPGMKTFNTGDPSFSLNYNQGKITDFPKSKFDANTVLRLPRPNENQTTTTGGGKGPGMKFNGFTPGEWTQFAGTMMPAFYNLAQSMRKPHKFKEFQNPYAGRYLSNLASQRMPYDDSKIVAQQNRVMRSAQQQAPNFQTAQAYQMAGMDGLNRQLKDYQMKNYMANQDYASKYNEAAYNVAGQQQAIKAQTHENDRKAQAALNQMQHKAITQMGIGIHDLGKLMVNREMNEMDWSLMGQIYQQYGLAPFEAVMSGKASYNDIITFNKNGSMTQFLNRYEKAKTDNAAAKQQQTTTTDMSNNGVNASVSTMEEKRNGGRVFNLNVIKKY